MYKGSCLSLGFAIPILVFLGFVILLNIPLKRMLLPTEALPPDLQYYSDGLLFIPVIGHQQP